MKRQSAIGAFFRPSDKRLRDLETESESDVRAESLIYGSTSSQASTLRNEEVGTNETELIDLIIEDSANDNPILPSPFDINTLPSELPTREGRNLQKDWFTNFSWLHYNVDGTCHCSSCLWAIKSNRLSRKHKEGIQNSKWVKVVDGWQDYRKGKSALQSHCRSSCHLAACNALQVRKIVLFLFVFT